MLLPSFIRAALCAIGISTVQAFAGSSGTEISVRSSPGLPPAEVMRIIGRTLSKVSHEKRETIFQNSSSFEKSWDGAVLLSLEFAQSVNTSNSRESVEVTSGIEITCTTCYLKASVLAELTIDRPFNITETFDNFTASVGNAVDNTTDQVVDYFKDYFKGVAMNLQDGFDLDDFDIPPLDIDFDIDVPTIPEVQLRFQFDDLEMYVALETVFSGGITYTLNLYTSQTPFGVMIDTLFFGAVVSVDLILSAEAEITISSGFHIKVDDGAELKLALFGDEIAETDFKGGAFEFLPVTIESAGVVLKAVLRVRVRAGLSISTPEIRILGIDVADVLDLQASAGVEVSVWTHLAELTTNVTIIPAGDELDGCQLRVEEHYQLGIGAAAGATVAFADHTWGPAPNTTIALFSTSFTQCAIQSSVPATVTSEATIVPRQVDGPTTGASEGASLTTTTISTEVTFRGVECMSSQLIDCPVSLQRTTKTSSFITLVTSVPSGVEATFPASIQTASVQPIPFGTAVKKLFETAVPTTESTPEAKESGFLEGKVGGVDKRIILGVSIGGGVLVLGLIIGGVIIWYRRRKYKAVPPPPRDQVTSYQSEVYKGGLYDPGRMVHTTTTEVRSS
ncbi:hypothetical protein TWF281_007771 [Arthrobotrys megalospora]